VPKHWSKRQRGFSLSRWRNIPLTLIIPEKGEEKAQACDIACLRQFGFLALARFAAGIESLQSLQLCVKRRLSPRRDVNDFVFAPFLKPICGYADNDIFVGRHLDDMILFRRLEQG
jgi:hypothetical protein